MAAGGSDFVEYKCGCGQFKPLDELFWSEPCSKLVCKDPTCSICEIDSYYCPFMLENMPSQEAMQYRNKSANCFTCPDCEAMLSVIVDDSKHFFVCSYCRWDSLDINLVEDSEQMLIMSSLSKERESIHETLVNELVQYYEKRLSPVKRKPKPKKPTGPWKWHDVEAKIETRTPQHVNDPEIQDCLNTIQPGGVVQEVSDTEQTSLHVRFHHPMDQPVDSRALWPGRLLLRTKKSYRCVAAMEKGLPGIVLKPQINPMTGDSSVHRMASWFKKANLAMHYLPTVFLDQVLKTEFHLLIINPLDESIEIEFDSTCSSTDVVIPNGSFTIGAHEDPNLLESFEASKSQGETNESSIEPPNPCIVCSKQNELILRFQTDAMPKKCDIYFQVKQPFNSRIQLRLFT